MFGGNSWTGQKDQRLFFVNPPQPPPRPPSLLTQQFPFPHYPLSNSTPRTNHAPSWSNPLPLPPPFPNCFENVDVIGPNRLGYLAPTPGNLSNKAKTVDVVERETTRPATIDESEYNILQNKVKCSMTNSQKDDARQIHSLTEHTSLLKHPTKHKPLPKSFSPHARQPIEQSTYPSRKRDMDAMQQTQEFKQRRYQRYTADSGEYVVQTSTKLVRKRATTPKPTQNTMKWTRDQAAAEEANTSAGSAKDTPEPEIEIVLVDSSQNSDDNAPQISPNGVMVVCEAARTPDPVSRTTERARSPEKTVHKSGSSSNHHTPGSVLPNRGQMSLRNINGHRITGDSRECFAHLTNSCKAGIFCRFEHRGSTAHHETKVCQRLLRGLCRPDSEQCRCEHAALLLHQYPLCVFFGRGDCVEGDKCTLLHVKHSTAARLCPEFLRGNCFAGDKCDYVHSYPYIVTKEKGTLEEITLPVEKSESTFRWIED